MKKSKNEIQNQVLTTIEAFSEIDRLKAGPDFYKKVVYKMHTRETVRRPVYFSLKATLQPLAIGLILAVNIYAGIAAFSTSQTTVSSGQTNIESFASQYMLAGNNTDWLEISSGEEE